MSFKLLSCLFVLALAAVACEGDSRRLLRNPNYRNLYYRNQFFGGLTEPSPVPIRVPTADRITPEVEEINDDNDDENDDTDDEILGDEAGLSEANSTISGNRKGQNDPNVLRPLLNSLRTSLRQLVKSENESKVVLTNILSVHEETLAWQKTQATRFFSLISRLLPSY